MAEALLILLVFVVAGTVKGVVGLGLPTVALGLLTASVGIETAIALMLAPSFVTNAWQGLSGGNARPADPEVSACPTDVPAGLCVLENPQLAADFPLIVGHQRHPPSPHRRLSKVSR